MNLLPISNGPADACVTMNERIVDHAIARQRLGQPVPLYRVCDLEFDRIAKRTGSRICRSEKDVWLDLEIGATTVHVLAGGSLDLPEGTISISEGDLLVARPPIERYLRVAVAIPGGSVEAGMQRARGEPLSLLRSELARVIGDEALVLNGDDVDDESAGRLIDAIEERITATWPQRAWFAEVWQAEEALCQVYAPWGMPRFR